MPGYRDRIVTIFHDKSEGGMNLQMTSAQVSSLAERGRCGATKLVERFAGSDPGRKPADGWDNQRWIRFRTATAGLDKWVKQFREAYQRPVNGATPYWDLAGLQADSTLPSYRLTVARRAALNRRTTSLLALAAEWESPPLDAFTQGAPMPRPRFRLVPAERIDDS
jgi:hypothetical protein